MWAASPLKQSTIDYFAGFDMPLLQYYGLSEVTGTITTNHMNEYRIAIGGRASPGHNIRIVNPDSEGKGEV